MNQKEFDAIALSIPNDIEVRSDNFIIDLNGYEITGSVPQNAKRWRDVSLSLSFGGREENLTDFQKEYLYNVLWSRIQFV